MDRASASARASLSKHAPSFIALPNLLFSVAPMVSLASASDPHDPLALLAVIPNLMLALVCDYCFLLLLFHQFLSVPLPPPPSLLRFSPKHRSPTLVFLHA